MLPCLGQSSRTTNNRLALDGYSVENTPRSGEQISPSLNLRRAYTFAVQTPSFGEIWTKIHQDFPSELNVDISEVNFIEEPLQLEEVLKPSREDVEEAVSGISEDIFVQHVMNFFNHSEETARKCLILSESVHHARHLYAPLHRLLDILPKDSETLADYALSQDQCDLAFEIFLRLDKLDNPFPGIDSGSSFVDMHGCYSELKKQLDIQIERSNSKLGFIRRATRGSAVCFLVAAVGVITCAILVATPALVILVATPTCPACLPLKITKKESAHLVRLDDASRETFVLDNHLETLDCLVDPLHNSVEGFKRDVRFVLERSNDRFIIHEVLKQLGRKNHKFLDQLTRLEEHLCLCFAAINRARYVLLNYLLIHSS